MTYSSRPSTMPTTPRGSSTYTSTTPRSVRRVLASSTSAGGLAALTGTPSRVSAYSGPSSAPYAPLPLPVLNTRVYPERPYAADDDLGQVLQADRDAVDEAVRLLEHSLSAHKKAVLEATEEIAAEKKRLETLTRELGDAARDMRRKMEEDAKDLLEKKEQEARVLTMGRGLQVQVETLQNEVKEVLNKLEARRELKSKQRAAFAKQAARNSPEIEFFEQKLGFKIRGKARDVVQFKYSNIDPASFPRSFSLDLDASKALYSVSSQSPASFLPPSTLDPALTRLNSTRDLFAFLREIRQAFVDEVELEKRVGREEEKEIERSRLRKAREREKKGRR
ncbi:hypothetical protein JCM11641_006567 [Rhodosporidiobolus odoratus]